VSADEYARSRVIATCEAQGVPIIPDAATLAAASALLAVRAVIVHEAAAA